MLKTLSHPSDPHKTYKMGRKRPLARRYGLRLGSFVDASKIELPPSTNYASKAMPCLDQIMLNDQLGDCTAAAAFHVEGLLQANAGRPQQKFSNAQVEAFYSATTGYKPGHPETDQGGDEATVLDYWRDHGLYRFDESSESLPKTLQQHHAIAGHATVDATNWDLVRTAIYLLENTYFGMSLPDAWVSPMPSGPGWTWDVAGPPVDENGHAVAGVDYDADTVTIASWGMLGKITRAATAKYARFSAGGELHTVFSYDAIDKASRKAPNGFMADELYAAFKAQFPETAA